VRCALVKQMADLLVGFDGTAETRTAKCERRSMRGLHLGAVVVGDLAIVSLSRVSTMVVAATAANCTRVPTIAGPGPGPAAGGRRFVGLERVGAFHPLPGRSTLSI